MRDEHKIDGEITVIYDPTSPKIWASGKGVFKIGLHVTDRDWAHFSYQFGHEFCHVIQHTDEFIGNNTNPQNGWFYEAIAELANLWVIRRMSKTWAYRAPYDNWVDYRHVLADYASNWMMSRQEVQYARTGAEWLQEWESKIRRGEPGAFTYARVSQLLTNSCLFLKKILNLERR